MSADLSDPIDVLNLSARSYNCLRRSGVHTVAQVASLSDEELLGIRNLGVRSLAEIREKLTAYLAEYPPKLEAVSEPESPTPEVLPADESPSEPSSMPLDPTPLDVLGLSMRPHNALMRGGITTIDQLASMSREQIQMVRNIGEKALTEIESRLAAYLAEPSHFKAPTAVEESPSLSPISPQPDTETLAAPIEKQTLSEQVEQLLSALTDRQRQVIRCRYGLDGEVLTLDEVGERLGVTRERVRQIQQQALRVLKKPRHYPRVRPLIALLTGLLTQAGGLMDGYQIAAALCHKLVIGDIDPIGAARLISSLTTAVKWLRKVNACGLTSSPLALVPEINRGLLTVLKATYAPTPVENVLVAFKDTPTYRDHQAELDDAFILACLRAHPQIEIGEDGLCSLEKWSRHRSHKIILALRQIGEPAHYSIIAERMNAMLPPERRVTLHNIHAELGRRTDLFVRVGHGIFGLREWGLPDDGNLANAAYRVLSEAGKPLHIEIITDRVLETWRVRRSSVYVAVDLDDRFVNIGRGVYWLRERMAEGGEVEGEADFGDLFGKRLERWQVELGLRDSGANYDTHAEADAIRQVGLDFFG